MFTYVENLPKFPEITTTTHNGQRWYVTPSGTYPSVTTVLGHGEKPWLKNWQNMLGPDKAKKEQTRCADRGTAVHDMIEQYLMNVPKEDILKGRDRDYVKLFNQIKLVLNKRVNNIHAQEIALWSDDFGLAGRVDCIGEYDGVLSIIDFKTSNNNKDESKIEDYFLQTTAYALMYNELYGTAIEDVVILITVEKGLMPLVFKKKIDDYVAPLLSRINNFYESI
jgi:genome maintenance exonuclease 1